MTSGTGGHLQFSRVVLLGAACTTTRLVAQALKEEGVLVRIVIPGRRTWVQRQRLRMKRRKLTGTLSFLACAVAAKALHRLRGGLQREQELLSDIGLADEWPQDVDRITVPSVNHEACASAINDVSPDLVVVNGTDIIKEPTLEAIRAPLVNTHTGITPDYRGAHGGFWAALNDDATRLGVTLHRIDRGVDTGEVIGQAIVSYDPQRDGLNTIPLLQYMAGIGLLREFVRFGRSTGPLPGSKGSKQWRTPGLVPYLKAVAKGKIAY